MNNNIRSILTIIKYKILKFQDALMYDDPIALESAGYSSLAAPVDPSLGLPR